MRTTIGVTLALYASLNLALAFSTSRHEQHDLRSTESIGLAGGDQCVEISAFHREIAYDIAADIAQRASQLTCSALKGCTRGVHWHVSSLTGDCSITPSYDDVRETLGTQLYKTFEGKVCEANCVRLAKGDEWELQLSLGTSVAAVQDLRSACGTAFDNDVPLTDQINRGLIVQKA